MQYFLSRHAIFDQKMKVFGYELSFCSGLDTVTKGDQQTSQVIMESFLLIGMEKITSGKKAFIQFSRNLLVNEFTKIFPKEILAVQIGKDIKVDDKVIDAVKEIKSQGYLIVLDDYSFQDEIVSLTQFADIIKVDSIKMGDYIKASIIQKLKPYGIKCLVKNVNNRDVFARTLKLGYDYFQGEFFSKCNIVAKKDVPGYKLTHLEMMKEIHQPELNFDKLEQIIKHDVSISYKLLRMINSAAYGLSAEIKSIKQALVIMGENEIKKWITLVLLSNVGSDKPDELMKTALIRARFLELIAPAAGMQHLAPDLFLMGMFSMMDVFLDQPLASILEGLPLVNEIKQTLLGEESPYKNVFNLIVCYEKGKWDQVQELSNQLRLDDKALPDLHLKSIEWMNQALSQSG